MASEEGAAGPARPAGVGDDEVSRAVEAVAGVARASVQLPAADHGGNLRIVFEAGVDRPDVARRVSTVLRNRFGLRVDPAAIERLAAGTGQDETPAPEAGTAVPAADDRPTIRGLEIDGTGLDVQTRVTLGLHDQTVTGHATAAATTRARLRAVGTATLEAVGLLVAEIARFELDELDIVDSSEPARVVATVSLLTYESAERLVGAALVRDGDTERAVVRATLDAVNRRVQVLLIGA